MPMVEAAGNPFSLEEIPQFLLGGCEFRYEYSELTYDCTEGSAEFPGMST